MISTAVRCIPAKILHALSLNNLDELVRWAQTADKMGAC
jgi:hypothetical protein